MPDDAVRLEGEARLFARYLVGSIPGEGLIARYVEACRTLFPEPGSARDEALLAFARRHSWSVSLLGGAVDLPESPYLLACLFGCPIFFLVALREGSARYRLFAEVLGEPVQLGPGERDKRIRELAAAYASRLEHYCIVAPYQWFNFFDYWREGAE